MDRSFFPSTSTSASSSFVPTSCGNDQSPDPDTYSLPVPGVLCDNAEKIRVKIRQLCGFSRNAFPGGQPVSLCKSNLLELGRNPYVACEKTDGIRFLLLAHSESIFLEGRKEEIRRIDKFYLPRKDDISKSQQLTLLDGELVVDEIDVDSDDVETVTGDPNNNSESIFQKATARKADKIKGKKKVNRYLIYDLICYEGDESVRALNLLQRLSICKAGVIEPLIEKLNNDKNEGIKVEPPLEIYLKDFFEIYDIEAIRTLACRLPHPSDGLIFTPVLQPYATGTCKYLLKWKPPHLNTVDFCVEALLDKNRVPKCFQLLLADQGFRVPLFLFLAPFGHKYKELLMKFKNGSASNGLIVECFFYLKSPVYTFRPSMRSSSSRNDRADLINGEKSFYDLDDGTWHEGGWVAERFRMDKKLPNDIRVFKKVMTVRVTI